MNQTDLLEQLLNEYFPLGPIIGGHSPNYCRNSIKDIVFKLNTCSQTVAPPAIETEFDESESPDTPRDLAVTIVDMCCGYTLEHAGSSSHHRYLYDRVTSFIQGIVNRGAAPAVSTPHCPKCGSDVIAITQSIDTGELPRVYCVGCKHTFKHLALYDFAQFFQPAPPSPEGDK